MARAQLALGDQHKEWSGTKPDLQVLSLLARYHGRKRMAADHLSWFNATQDETSLYAARRELNGSLRVWQDLVKLTDGLYPARMAYGPSDMGHWKDKLPVLEADAKELSARDPAPTNGGTARRWPHALPLPTFQHNAPKLIAAGTPIMLALQVWPPTHATQVRLHYRALNQLAAWKTVEGPAQRAIFTISGEEIDARWDLQYYFEILNSEGSGWFWPDPRRGTPYHVVTVEVMP